MGENSQGETSEEAGIGETGLVWWARRRSVRKRGLGGMILIASVLLVMTTVSGCETPTPTAVRRPPVVPVPGEAKLVDVVPIPAHDTKMYVYELPDDWYEHDVALYYLAAAERLGWRDFHIEMEAFKTTWSWTDKDGLWVITIGWDGELFYGVAPLE